MTIAWAGTPTAARRYLAAAACVLAVHGLLRRLASTFAWEHQAIAYLGAAAFLAGGYMLWLYAETILDRPWPRGRLAVIGAGVAVYVWAAPQVPSDPSAATPETVPAALAVVGVWFVAVGVALVRLALAARTGASAFRRSVRYVVIGYGAFALLATLTVSGRLAANDVASVAVSLAGLTVCLPLMWAGFTPPQWLLRRWEKRERDAARTRLLLKRLPAILWTTDRELTLTSLEGAGLSRIGRTRGELLGRPLNDLFDPIHTNLEFWSLVESALTGNAGESIDVQMDGGTWAVRLEAVFGGDGAVAGTVGLATDVTERAAAEAAAAIAVDRLVEAERTAHAGSWTWDPDKPGSAVWSDALRDLIGVGRDFKVTRNSFFGFVHPGDRARVTRFTESVVRDREPFDIEYRVVTAAGDVRWVRGRGRCVESPHGGRGVLYGTIQDVTSDRMAAQALAAAYERERQAAERLRVLDDTKNAFLAAVSHELRTPLAVVLGMVRTLRAHDFSDRPAQLSHFLGRVEANAERLDYLLTDLLDLNRLVRGAIEPQRFPVDLGRLVRDAVAQIDKAAHPVEIRIQDLVADLDPGHVERIVENLVGNAVKHTPAETHIWVDARRLPDGVLITVADDGPGVDPLRSHYIFEPFRRGDTQAAGTGVGLALVARLAELHGGRAWCEPRTPKGALFMVFLADAPAHVEAEPDEDAVPLVIDIGALPQTASCEDLSA